MKNLHQFIILCLVSILIINPLMGFELPVDDIEVHCQQTEDKQNLQCNYRSKLAKPVTAISAYAGNQELVVILGNTYPSENDTTAVFFLIDSSGPARQHVIMKNIQHLEVLLDAAQDHHRFAIASFDENLRLHAPFGSDKFFLIEAAKKLQANGKTTELYRNVLQTIRLFEDIETTRKLIILFSSGLTEDQTYFHADVVKKARMEGIIINTIGYMLSPSELVALQRLHRLSEDTGGLFIEANNNFELPADFLLHPYQSIDNGVEFAISLFPVVNNSTANVIDVSIFLSQNTLQTTTIFPIATILPPRVKNIPFITPSKVILDSNNHQQKNTSVYYWLLYIAIVILILLLLFTVTTLFISLKTNRTVPLLQPGSINNISEDKAYAYLIKQNNWKIRYPITKSIWRIGRSGDNELVIKDSSVSRYHAEIHCDNAGNFILIDINSKNGVYLNHQRVGKLRLSEGDTIEISNINFYFTLKASDYFNQPLTLMGRV